MSGEFVARMEDVLELSAEPLDEARPVVCLDELSKEWHGHAAEPIAAAPGRPAQEDYEYKRNGTGHGFLLRCPLLGWRPLQATERRGSLEFAQWMKDLVDVPFPKAETIRVVWDNLNTHVFGAFYEAFTPAEARRMAWKLEFHYTPKHGSWLNRAEREFSVLSRQRLDRRIATAQELADAIAAWERERNEARTTIEWSFRVADARRKLHWIYPS